MDLKRIYDYMTGRPETYKGLKDVGYDDFEKSMGDARYRRGVYNQLYINGGINSRYDVFEGSWQKTYGEPAAGAGETGVVNGDVEPVLDINSTRILGAEDFERYEAEQKPSSTMDTYDYEKMRVDPEKERQRLDAFRGELEEEGVNPESVYAAIDAGEKEIEKGWQEALQRRDDERREDSRVPVGPNFARVEGMYEDTPAARDLSNFSLAKDLYDDARNLLDASFKGSGFGRGVWDAVYDVDAWTAGLTELGKNVQLNRVYEKAKKGEELTASEARLLDAANYYTLAGALQQAYLPSEWYRWGQGLGGSIPYMLEFALTYGPASSVTKGLARAVFKKLGGGTVGRVGGEVIHGVTTGAVQTPLNATNVASGTYRRMMGNAEVATDENGVPVFIGMTDQKGFWQALGEATGAQYIENLSEVSGRMLSGAGHLIKRSAPRYVQEGLEKISDNRYVRAMADNAFTRGLRKVGKRFKIGNAPEEIYEEYFGGTINGLLIGDTDLESLYSMQSFVEITGTVAVTQVFLGAVGASMNHRSKRSLVKRYEKAEREYDALFSSPEERDMYVSYVNLNLNGVQGKGGKPMLTVLREAVEKMVNSHGDNFVRADGTFDTEAAKAYREEVSRVFGNYFVAKQLYDSYMAGIRTRKEADRERIATEMQEKAVNGQIMTVTLADGRRARVVSGDIVVDGDGRIDVGRSGDHFTAVYEDDGSTVQLPVEDSYTVEVVSVEDAVEAASRANDELINREEEEAVYGPRPKLGETVTMLDSEGNRVQLVVSGEVDESGNFMAMPMEDFDNNVKGMAVAVNMSQIVRDDAASEGVDGANEYQSFVNEGTVSDATVERIAGKIANGESLTAEEEAMRQGANERVEGALAKLRDMEGEKQGESALSRIEKDAKGQPLYEKADVETAWDALVEQSEGDESIARDVAASMVKDKEAALKKMEKAPAKGATPAEKIADAKVRKENIDKARAELEHWQAIAGVSQTHGGINGETGELASEGDAMAEAIGRNRFGTIYQWTRGKFKEAAAFLRKKQGGYIKGVFHRDDIGDIDMIWGNDKAGLKHIIQKHIVEHDDFDSVAEAMETINRVIENGTESKQGTNISFDHEGYRVSIAQSGEGNWVLTAFDMTRGLGEKKRFKGDATIGDQNTSYMENGTLVSPQLESSESEGSEFEGEKQGKSEENAVQSETPQVAGDVAESPVGRSLNAEEADMLISQMEQSAEVAPEMELTPENWIREFGKGGIVRTPIGDVKQGENQYLKLAQQGRNSKLGMVRPTLERPNIIIEDERPAKEGESERNTSYVFVKTFTKSDGSRYYYFASVTVSKDGKEVVISSQERSGNRISKLLQQGKVAWIDIEFSLHPTTQVEGSVPLNDSNTLTYTDNQPALLGINSSELSTSESIERIGEKQGKSEENAVISSEEDIDVTVGRVMEIPDAGDRSALVSGLLASAKAEEKSVSRVKNKVDPRNTQAFLAEQQRIRGEQDKARAEVAYWEEVKRIVEESNATESAPAEPSKVKAARPKSIRERISALGEVLNLRDYILRALATGEYKFIWGDNRNGTKGLGSHLGFGNNRRGIEERQRRIWLLNNEEGLYPEQVAERLYANIQAEYPYLAQDDVEVFNEMLDVLRYDSAKDMVSEAEDMRRRREEMYEEYDSDQAMYDATMQERDERVDAENEAYRRELESQESGTPAEGRAAEPLGDTVAAAEAEVNTNPTEKQKEAGNYRKGHVRIDGFNVTIENPKGSIRSGVDATGKEWSITMNNTYGYMRGTQGVDGDHIDVFLSDNPDNGNVYIVDQINQETGEFDEHKVMYGFNSMEEAKEAYLSNYSEGWKIGNVTEVSKEEFKKWVNSSHRKTKPFAEYSSINTISGESGDAVTDNLTPNTETTAIQGFDGYSQSEIKSIVQEYIQQKLDENDISANVVGIAVHGSRVRGNAKENSDLDVVVEYEGDIREDGMFNLLNDDDNGEALYIEGIRVDINPIRAQETGTLDKYMERSRKYDEEVLSNDSVEDSHGEGDVRYRKDEEKSGVGTDIQGNPVDENGTLFRYFTGSLSELISQARKSATNLIKKVIAPVSSRLRKDLNNQGLQIDDDYNHVIDNNAIRHTLKKHSGKNEEKRGQIPITETDFEYIADVVENYDAVEVVPSKTSAQRIIYRKAYSDGSVVYVEEQRVGRKELAAVTMWKKKSPNLTDANRFETTQISDLTEALVDKDSETSVTGQETAEKVDGEDTRYRRGEDGVQGVRRTQESEMEREVRGFGERMADRLGGGVRLVYSDEIADSEAHAEEKRRSKGYYDTATGEVVVVLDNNTVKGVPSVIEVAMTMMHEVVGHKGVRGLFGTKEDAFLDDVYRGMKARTKAEMESLYGGQLRRRAGESEEAFEARRRRLMADEYIARVAEEGNNPGLLRRVGAKVRGLLRGLGVELAITDNEIRDILRRSARELTRRKDGAMNVREDGGVRYRQSVNERFNKELEQQIDGTLPKGHIYQLGLPGEILRSTGIPDLPIELSSARLAEKAAQRNHEFELSDVKGLPEALENPIAIFSYGNKDKAQNIIVEIEKAGKKFVVGLHLNQDRRGILVNDIRGIFPKDNAEWLNWISQGKLLYVDKKKIQDLIDKQRTNLAEVEYLDLDSITNIVKEFENPTVGGENVRYRRSGEEETEFSKKYNLNEEDVSNYAYHMSMGNLGGATRAFHEIRRKVRIDNDGTSLGRFTKIFTPIKRELYSRFGNIDELRDSIERTNEEARREMESVRKKAEEEAAAERRRIAVFQRMTDEQLDEEYMKAVSEKDESRLRDLVNEAARRNGYGDIDSEYQGVGAWSAPANPGYGNSEIRHASYEREGGAVNVLDIEQGYSPQPDNYFTNLRVYGNDTPHGRESASAIYRAIQSIKSGKNPKIKVYRAVPSTVKEGKLRNGDWVTPSKKYAEMHGNHRLEGDYRIIEQEVSAEDLWWDGNDINEWGYDDGNSYAYRNTKNNRKLYELITRDDEGRIIPLSERFNSRREDVRYRLTEEEQGIVEEAKRDGSYMKAPNGAPTRLTEKQWAGVRTKAFKAWFGDWEKAARIEKLRKSEPVEISGEEYKGKYELNRDSAKQWLKENVRGEYVIADTGERIEVSGKGIEKVTSHSIGNKAHMQSLVAIPQLIENATFIEERPNEKANGKYDSYRYYVCGLKIGGVDYTVKVTIGVKQGKKYYDHALTEIEKGNLIEEIANGFTTTVDAPVPSSAVSKDTKLLSILQVNSLKDVDENGEPTIFEPTGEVDKSNGDEESGVLYRKVTDMDTLKRLEEEPTIKVYRAMANIDGKLYPPMSTKIDGKLRAPIELGVWEEAEERPDLVDEKGNFKLKKDNGTTVPARYNPYIHTSRTPLNDQFSSAYKRPNLVTVEVEVPVSELTSGYHAEKAKDSVGEKSWHAGPVSGKLPTGKKRKVILSRWDKPIRIVPDEEVAKKISEILDGENIPIPYNVITPSLRKELEKLGVLIKDVGRDDIRYRAAEADYASVQDDASGEYAEALSAPMDISVADMMPIEAAENAQAAGLLRDVVNRFPDTKIAITDLSRVYAAAEVAEIDGDRVRYRREVNERFNEELERQIAGELPKGHVYSLGRPSEVLLAAGIPDLPIELAASRLGLKASAEYESNHPFELREVMNLPEAIQHPIAVFDSKTRVGSKVILVELKDRNGNNFVVAMNTNVPKSRYSKASIQINDIRSIYPKDNVRDIVGWINRGDLLRYADKKKIEDWITQQRSNSAEVEIQNLDVAANIVKEFENPTIDGENVRYRRGISFDTRGASHRDTDITGRRERSFGEKASRLAGKAGISLYDEQLKLKQLQGKVAEWLTGSRKGALDDRLLFYEAENQAGSIAMDRKVRFDNEYRERLFALRAEVFKALGNKVDDKYYFYAKTLNERTGVIGEEAMAANKATMFSHLLSEQHPGHDFPEGFFDPKEYGYEALQAYARKEGWIDSIEGYIADCESRMGEKLVNDIWGVIGEIAEYQLTTSMKKGLITRDHFDRLMYGRPLAELVRENLEKGLITEGQYRAFLATDFTADELVKAGFITREQREGLKRRYEYYLPLKGDSEPTTEEVADYERSRSRVSWQIKSVKGGNTRLVNDPVSRLLADVYASISYQEKMAWIQSMYHALRLAERQGKGAGDFAILDNWVVKDETGDYVPYVRYVEGEPVFTPTEQEIAKGEVERARNLPIETAIRVPEAVQGEHIVKLKHRGRTIHIYFRDPAVANAVNNHFVPRNVPKLMKGLRAAGGFMGKVYTQWNIFFSVRNLSKDFGEAAINNYVQYGGRYMAEYMVNYWRVMRHAGTTLRGAKRSLVPRNDYERRVEEFFKYGGEVSYTQIESYDKAIRDFERELKRSADKRGVVSVTEAGFVKIGKAVSAANKLIELNARLATFITSRERGYGLRQSIRDAKEVTVNFDRRGRNSMEFGSLFLFWNAGRQSNRRKWELMRENPGRFWTSRAAMGLLNVAQTYVLGSALAAVFGVDWEDYMTGYYDIPDYIRYNNIVVMSADGKVYRIPLSPAFAPYKTLVENIGEATYRTAFNDRDGRYDWGKGMADIVKSVSADLGDLTTWEAEGGKRLIGWAPAPTVPLLEAMCNVDFTGRPVYKVGNSATPGYKRAYAGTKDVYVEITEWLNRVSGGEEAYGSWVGRRANPGAVQHVVEGYLGGLIQVLSKFWNVPEALKGASYERLPFVDTFYYGDAEMLGEREVRDDIYDARRLVESYNDVRSNFRKTDEDYENNPKTSQYLENNEYRIDELKDLLKKYDEVTEELKSEDSEAYRRELRLLRRSIVELTNEMEEY